MGARLYDILDNTHVVLVYHCIPEPRVEEFGPLCEVPKPMEFRGDVPEEIPRGICLRGQRAILDQKVVHNVDEALGDRFGEEGFVFVVGEDGLERHLRFQNIPYNRIGLVAPALEHREHMRQRRNEVFDFGASPFQFRIGFVDLVFDGEGTDGQGGVLGGHTVFFVEVSYMAPNDIHVFVWVVGHDLEREKFQHGSQKVRGRSQIYHVQFIRFDIVLAQVGEFEEIVV